MRASSSGSSTGRSIAADAPARSARTRSWGSVIAMIGIVPIVSAARRAQHTTTGMSPAAPPTRIICGVPRRSADSASSSDGAVATS